ncbi:CPBP family intramembrane glutamic endopeptidase [Rufibacter sediminis]|uniref:CPBP family intramembrane metalloprotease n=1 Tax=Rufibacter sediminis TaxID=2762756 RepID=A0ABR6VUZ8_9BACT|nr:type II CAAX endopeptidase family protein [Rufibacter sediminis]MBC3541025.1 CPBP family intramembrane metalloprotease [Rufibacter sediminis]
MTFNEYSGLTVKQGWFLIFRLIAFSILLSIPLLIGKMLMEGYTVPPLLSSLGSLLTYALPFVLVIRVGLKWSKSDLRKDMKEEFARIDYGVLGVVVLLTPFLGILLEPLFNLLPPPPEFLNKAFKELMQPNVISFLAIAVAPALLEEMLCRGIILKGLLERYSVPKAIIWSAVLFGAMHLNPWQGITGVVLGLFIGWVYYRTRSIYPGILIHFANNAISFFTWLAWGDTVTSLEELMPPTAYYVLVAASLLLVGAGVWFLNKRMPKSPEVALDPFPEATAVV